MNYPDICENMSLITALEEIANSDITPSTVMYKEFHTVLRQMAKHVPNMMNHCDDSFKNSSGVIMAFTSVYGKEYYVDANPYGQWTVSAGDKEVKFYAPLAGVYWVNAYAEARGLAYCGLSIIDKRPVNRPYRNEYEKNDFSYTMNQIAIETLIDEDDWTGDCACVCDLFSYVQSAKSDRHFEMIEFYHDNDGHDDVYIGKMSVNDDDGEPVVEILTKFEED